MRHGREGRARQRARVEKDLPCRGSQATSPVPCRLRALGMSFAMMPIFFMVSCPLSYFPESFFRSCVRSFSYASPSARTPISLPWPETVER